jgi:hypothetical protein
MITGFRRLPAGFNFKHYQSFAGDQSGQQHVSNSTAASALKNTHFFSLYQLFFIIIADVFSQYNSGSGVKRLYLEHFIQMVSFENPPKCGFSPFLHLGHYYENRRNNQIPNTKHQKNLKSQIPKTKALVLFS